MHNATFSALDRLVSCPGAFALPWATSTGDAAETGNEIHGWADAVASGRELPELSAALRARCARYNLAPIIGDLDRIQTEAAYAFDVRTRKVRYLGHHLGRQYGASDTEIAGALDVVGVVGNRPVYVDWKTGQHIGEPAGKWQMRAGAICLAKHFGASEVEVRVAYLPDGEDAYADSHVFDVFELLGYEDELERAYDKRASGDVHEGDHCKYCPALTSCPAKTRLALAIAGGTEIELTPERAGEAWQKIRAMEQVIDRAKSAIKLMASRDAVLLPGGKRLRVVQASRTSFDREKAESLLEGLGATQDQIEGCVKTTRYEMVKEVKSDG